MGGRVTNFDVDDPQRRS
jgi:hypothetical protein